MKVNLDHAVAPPQPELTHPDYSYLWPSGIMNPYEPAAQKPDPVVDVDLLRLRETSTSRYTYWDTK